MPSYSPYDWNESIQQRNEYIEDRLRDGSPVVCVPYNAGLLILTLRQTQRKVYEVYDKMMFSAIGNHSDIEQIRVAAIDVAHNEGFTRSPEDVSVQRLVSFRISPAIKKIYSDPYAQPVVFKGLFAELGKTPDRDLVVSVSYDGEFSATTGCVAVAGTSYAEDEMRRVLGQTDFLTLSKADAARAALQAWAVGKHHLETGDRPDMEPDVDADAAAGDVLTKHLGSGWTVEAGVLERDVTRESRFRLLTATEVSDLTAPHVA